jgi:glycine reductase
MPLEVGTFPVREMNFGAQTRWQDGVLEIDRDEILGLVMEDAHLPKVALEIVRPGESVRVINYSDIVEPKVKVDGPGTVYPGICGRPTTRVGEGRTHRLGGCAVVECIDTGGVGAEQGSNMRSQSGSPALYFDMSGTSAVTPNASRFGLCLIMEAPNLGPEDRHRVIHSATLKVADRLAETVAHLDAPELERFDLTPDPSLPGAVFIPHLASSEWVAGPRSSLGFSVYGQTRLSAPWLLEGTEMLDGAVSQGRSMVLSNNPVVEEMCRRHGDSFNFVGCIIQRTNWTMQVEKEMAAERAAHLASRVGAHAAIVTTNIRGQRFVETVLTVQACEQAGIKAVLLSGEEDPEGGTAPPFLVSPPELVAVVSTGTGYVPAFPTVEKVVGAVSEADEQWFGEMPAIPGRYGAYHNEDNYGIGRESLVDF